MNAQIFGGISFNDDGPQSFYLALGQTYGVPEREVIIIHERQIPDDEIPVVFFIANRAHVRREVIVEHRLAGRSWMEITLLYHLDPSIFYEPNWSYKNPFINNGPVNFIGQKFKSRWITINFN